MENKKENISSQCGEYMDCRDSLSSWVFFYIGLIATIAIRIVTVLMHMRPIYGKIAWYIGIIGFSMFFVYKFQVNYARAKYVTKSGLSEKIRKNEPLDCDDYSIINSILCSMSSKKERINYFFIFFLSALALILAVYMDFIR